jgi:hypothetical protein
MPIRQADPWRLQYFEGVAGPAIIEISAEVSDAKTSPPPITDLCSRKKLWLDQRHSVKGIISEMLIRLGQVLSPPAIAS